MLEKLGNIAAPINYYLDKETKEQRKFCRVIGSILQNEHGLLYVSLNQDFNLLGCLHDPQKGNVLLQVIMDDSKTLESPKEQNKPIKVKKKATRRRKTTKAGIDAANELIQPFDDPIDF